jgi:DNA-binding NarL/FixJ family response regulator
MTDTINLDLGARAGTRLRVELREPIPILCEALGLAVRAIGLDLHGDDGDGTADVIVWAIDARVRHRLPALRSGPPVLALVDGCDEVSVRRLYTAGARGVLDRGTDPEVIVRAAATVASGLMVSHPDMFVPVPDSEPLLLDRNEMRWMRALGSGVLMAALAHSEGHSERDMYRKLRGVYAKLGVSGKAEALVLLGRADLLRERRSTT